uniref:Uncharacterized protein n=1 Tax=Anopheles christyi TaxID=43041 RepID=A0A182KJ50_9DIPT
MIAAHRFTHQHPEVASPRQLQHTLDAARRPAILAQQLEVSRVRLGYEHLRANVGVFATLLDFDRLRQYLVLAARVQKQGRALQRRIGQCRYAQAVVLTLDDLTDRGQLALGKVPQVGGRCVRRKPGRCQNDLPIGGGHTGGRRGVAHAYRHAARLVQPLAVNLLVVVIDV